MIKRIGLLTVIGTMLISGMAFADDDKDSKMDKYEDYIEKLHPYVNIENKKYELDYDLEDMGAFIIMDVEVEDSFFGRKTLPVDGALVKTVDSAANTVKDDFNKPVKVAVEYKDKTILEKQI